MSANLINTTQFSIVCVKAYCDAYKKAYSSTHLKNKNFELIYKLLLQRHIIKINIYRYPQNFLYFAEHVNFPPLPL